MEYLLDDINSMMNFFTEAKSLKELCQIIFEKVAGIIKIEEGCVFLAENGKFEKVYSTENAGIVRIGRKDAFGKFISRGEIFNLDKESFDKFNFSKKEKWNSGLCVPFVYQSKPVGFVLFFSANEIALKEAEHSLLQFYANTASMYIKKTQLNAEVRNALEIRDQFISLASHELRTPLTSINGYIQLLYRKLSKEDTQESRWVKELYEESYRLTSLIKELLDINRIKQGQLEFILNEVVVSNVVENAINRFSFSKYDNKIVFLNKLENRQERIIGDSNKLLQMVSAILNNAAKFSYPGSQVDITLCSSGRFVVLRVKDRGKGIPKQEIRKIFNGFYKIDKDEKQGLGVGLLLAQHIVRHHRGKIEITSKENIGTTIEVQLPKVNF